MGTIVSSFPGNILPKPCSPTAVTYTMSLSQSAQMFCPGGNCGFPGAAVGVAGAGLVSGAVTCLSPAMPGMVTGEGTRPELVTPEWTTPELHSAAIGDDVMTKCNIYNMDKWHIIIVVFKLLFTHSAYYFYILYFFVNYNLFNKVLQH